MDENLWIAFGLTLMAGLATGIGSLLAFFTSTTNTKFLSFSLSFSAGVMIYVSMVEIFFKAQESLTTALGEKAGAWMTVFGFFGGIMLIAIIDRLIPNSSQIETEQVDNLGNQTNTDPHLQKIGTFTALAIAIHNFPEGIATFTATLQDPTLGIPIAVAIAIHNIPEGIAISAPIYYATGSKKKAFKLSFLSGLAEPAGAIIAYLVLMPFLSEAVFGVVFASVAGIMIFISLDELLPAAKQYDEGHTSIYGLILGMAVMALSILLFI